MRAVATCCHILRLFIILPPLCIVQPVLSRMSACRCPNSRIDALTPTSRSVEICSRLSCITTIFVFSSLSLLALQFRVWFCFRGRLCCRPAVRPRWRGHSCLWFLKEIATSAAWNVNVWRCSRSRARCGCCCYFGLLFFPCSSSSFFSRRTSVLPPVRRESCRWSFVQRRSLLASHDTCFGGGSFGSCFLQRPPGDDSVFAEIQNYFGQFVRHLPGHIVAYPTEDVQHCFVTHSLKVEQVGGDETVCRSEHHQRWHFI